VKYLWIILFSLVLTGCGSQLWFTPHGHRLFYKSADGQLSCYTNNCCFPYKEKAMVCATATADPGGGMWNTIDVDLKIITDK
jgi:hypothetical protein